MARGLVFSTAKPIAVLVSAMMLSTLHGSVLKITEELRSEEAPPIEYVHHPTNTESPEEPLMEELGRSANTGNGEKPLMNQFVDMVKQLAEQGTIADEQMLVDEEMLGDEPISGRSYGSSSNGTRNGKDVESDFRSQYREMQKEMWLSHITQRLRLFTGQGNVELGNKSISTTSSPTASPPPRLPIYPSVGSEFRKEAIPPLCPVKNDEHLTVSFNISEPRASSRNKILSVLSAELKLYKIPVKLEGESDEVAETKWRETFNKAHVQASDEVIASKANEQRMVTITVYKIRNKSKNNDRRKLDTRMVPASFSGITTWNVTKAINVWGNDTKRTLNLVITVEDDSGNEIPAQNVFEMRCGNYFDKPYPVGTTYVPSNRTHTAWINLSTEERAVNTEAYNAAASAGNRMKSETYEGDGSAQRVTLTLDQSLAD